MLRSGQAIAMQPKEADIRVALGRLLASPGLKKSPQLVSFLTFIIDETLAGRGDRIKAYNIAADALGRDADFDPQKDPIVRVEAGRLRRALDHYYANDGGKDPVIIELPRGRYEPMFKANAAPADILARLARPWRALAASLHKHAGLVMTIVVIAAIVTLAMDLAYMLLERLS
jgi:hypothetical protein